MHKVKMCLTKNEYERPLKDTYSTNQKHCMKNTEKWLNFFFLVVWLMFIKYEVYIIYYLASKIS